jgi:hypothetical protein
MVSLRTLTTAAAAAVIGGSLLAVANPAAAVEAHSGIQPSPTAGTAYHRGSYDSPCYFVRKPVRDVYGQVVGFRPGNSCEWTGHP